MPKLPELIKAWLTDSGLYADRFSNRPSSHRLAKTVLIPLIKARVPGDFRGTSPLDDATQDRVITWLEGSRLALEHDLRCAEQDTAAARQRGSNLSTSAVQERVAAVMRKLYEQNLGNDPSAPLQPAWQPGSQVDRMTMQLYGNLAKDVVQSWLAEAGAGSRDDFQGHWGSEFDRLWDAAGEVNLREHPPSTLGLGEDRKPTPTAAGPRLATDRSPYDRVCLYHDGRTKVADADLEAIPGGPDGRPVARFAGSPEPGADIVMESLQRTCSQWGLTEPRHHALLRILHEAISAGYEAAGDHASRTVTGHAPGLDQACRMFNDPDPDRLDPDPDRLDADPDRLDAGLDAGRDDPEHLLWAAVMNRARAGATSFIRQNHQVDEVQATKVAIRRLWLRMHAWEIVDHVISPPALARSIRATLDNAPREPAAQRPDGWATPFQDVEFRSPGPSDQPFAADASPGTSPGADLVQQAVGLLRRKHPDTDSPTGLMAHYQALFDEQSERGQQMLPDPGLIAQVLGCRTPCTGGAGKDDSR